MNVSRRPSRAFQTQFLIGTLALGALPRLAVAQFIDPFTSISPAWTQNRYNPAGFDPIVFGGDSRLRLTIDPSGSAANRPAEFSSGFYNTQGRQRPGEITGPWSLNAQVFVSSSFNTTTGPLVRSDLWGHTGTTPGGGDYLILGFTNASTTEVNLLDPAALDRAFRFRAFDSSNNSWIDLGVPAGFVFDAWHTLSGRSTGTTFEYRIDDVLVLTRSTGAGNDLLSAMVQGYNFGQASPYAVLWDNVSTTAIPEPAVTTLIVALAVGGLVLRRRLRQLRSPSKSPPPSGENS